LDACLILKFIQGMIQFMAESYQPVSISSEELLAIKQKLSTARHNINNHLALIVAAAELVKRKPDMAERLSATFLDQPKKIMTEISDFTHALEKTLGIAE